MITVSDVEGHIQSIRFPGNHAARAITKDYKSPGEAQQRQPKGDGGGQMRVLGDNTRTGP